MKIRGERECTDCGTRWSYYETGAIGCPACGSVRSVGTDERTEHTDIETPFDLTSVRTAIDEAATDDLADRAKDEARSYVRQRGFISGGSLEPLDDDYLAATELVHVADIVTRARTHTLTEDEELYFLSLLRDADDGERPPTDTVPYSLRGARGLAYANAVRDYRRDIRTWAENETLSPDTRSAFESLGDHVTRIRMLDGDVPPETAETLLEATRALSTALCEGEDAALARANDHLEDLSAETALE